MKSKTKFKGAAMESDILDTLKIAKGEHLRVGQAIFVAIYKSFAEEDRRFMNHHEGDSNIGHRLFYITDEELGKALEEMKKEN